MSWINEFRKAFEEYPTQDNEGHVPDRGGFKAGYCSAWHSQQQKIYEKDAEIALLKSKLQIYRDENERYSQQSLHYLDTVTGLRTKLDHSESLLRKFTGFHPCSDVGCLHCEAEEYFLNIGV